MAAFVENYAGKFLDAWLLVLSWYRNKQFVSPQVPPPWPPHPSCRMVSRLQLRPDVYPPFFDLNLGRNPFFFDRKWFSDSKNPPF